MPIPASRRIAPTRRPGPKREASFAAGWNPGAFTLIEVVLASGILVLIAVMLGVMAGNVSRMWLAVNGQTQRRSDGRALLEFIARDLQSAQLPIPISPLATSGSSGNLEFVVSPSNSSTSWQNPHAIFWQAPVATNSGQGKMAEIGYFVQWDTTTKPGVAKAYLCRYYADAATSGSGFGIYRSGIGNISGGSPPPWLSTSGAPTTVAPALPSGQYAGWLADNVIALWIQCYSFGGLTAYPAQPIVQYPAIGTGQRTTTPNGGSSFDSLLGFYDPISSSGKRPPPLLPAAVQISLVVVDASTAQKITTPLNSYNASNVSTYFNYPSSQAGSVQNYVSLLPSYIRSGTQIYSTIVPLQNITN